MLPLVFTDMVLKHNNPILCNSYNGTAFLHTHFLSNCLMAQFSLKLCVYIYICTYIYMHTHMYAHLWRCIYMLKMILLLSTSNLFYKYLIANNFFLSKIQIFSLLLGVHIYFSFHLLVRRSEAHGPYGSLISHE